MAATTILSTLDLGHQGFLGNEFNLTAAKGAGRLRSTLASGLRVAALLGAMQFVIAVALVWAGKVSLFLGVGDSLLEKQRLDSAFLLMVGVWCMFGSTSGLLVRLYPPQGLYARAQWLSLIQRLVLQFGVVIAVAMGGGGIWDFAVSYSVVGTVLAVFWFLEFRHRLSALYPWWKGGSWMRAWKNLRSSLLLTGNGILTQSVTNGSSLMIAILFDAAVVPAFTTVRAVANMFFQAAGVIVNPLVPDLVRFHVRGEWSKLIQTIQ
ncbi:MAG: hypothetical protein Q8J78_09540, partial [Moraxellaceae bacterium]|nr:hypothetical protein [Moraxellaceae bacterium]